MDPLDLALLQLDGLIAGIESGSSIPVQASELKFIQKLIQMAKESKTVPIRKD